MLVTNITTNSWIISIFWPLYISKYSFSTSQWQILLGKTKQFTEMIYMFIHFLYKEHTCKENSCLIAKFLLFPHNINMYILLLLFKMEQEEIYECLQNCLKIIFKINTNNFKLFCLYSTFFWIWTFLKTYILLHWPTKGTYSEVLRIYTGTPCIKFRCLSPSLFHVPA